MTAGTQKIGTLIMAGTCLGDAQDIPSRSLQALRSADLLIFEEDRPARQILKAAGLQRNYLKYTEHGEQETLAELENALRRGATVIYMSDQGTPGLADPGRDLTAVAFRLGAHVKVIPGPSSITAAIAACPFDCRQFNFLGFLPREEEPRREELAHLVSDPTPAVILDTPYRLRHLLTSCHATLGQERRGFLALDISGEGETYWCGRFSELVQRAEKLTEKLNFVLIIEGSPHAGKMRPPPRSKHQEAAGVHKGRRRPSRR